MPWTKLDDQFFFNPKIIAAGRDARDVYIASLTYSAGQLTDGRIPSGALMLIGAMAVVDDVGACADKLIDVGLWEPVDGGYEIHDYHEYNPPVEKVKAIRKARAEAGRKGGRASRASKEEANAEAKPEANAQAKGKRNRTPSPSPSPYTDDPQKDRAQVDAPDRASKPRDNGHDSKEEKSGPSALQREQYAKRHAVREHFERCTGLACPERGTADAKGMATLWWNPIRMICEEADWNVKLAMGLVDAAIDRLDGCTIKAPKSILDTCKAIMAEERSGRGEGLGESRPEKDLPTWYWLSDDEVWINRLSGERRKERPPNG